MSVSKTLVKYLIANRSASVRSSLDIFDRLQILTFGKLAINKYRFLFRISSSLNVESN